MASEPRFQSRLFIAGLVPAAIILSSFMVLTGIWSIIRKSDMPPEVESYGFRDKLKGLAYLLPVVGLMFGVIGSIYAGWATPTESAAVGVLGALILSALTGSLTRKGLADSLMGTAYTTCMIGFIVAGAQVMSVMFAYTKILDQSGQLHRLAGPAPLRLHSSPDYLLHADRLRPGRHFDNGPERGHFRSGRQPDGFRI